MKLQSGVAGIVSVTWLAVGSAATPASAREEARIEAARETPEVGGAYRSVRLQGFELAPEALVVASDGAVLVGGVCTLEDRGAPRTGFGVLKLDPSGAPDLEFGKKLGDGRIGLAFVPLDDGDELLEVVAMALQAGKREKLVVLGNVQPVGGAAHAVVARIDVDDGRPSKLGGQLALHVGFGEGLQGRSRARALAAGADAITVAGDWNGHPGFLRLDGEDGDPEEGFAQAGKQVVEVQSFATPAYEHRTDFDACVFEEDGGVLGIGRLLATDDATKAFQILVALRADGSRDVRFGLPSALDGGATRAGATTSFYQLPEDFAVCTDLSMCAAVAVVAPDDEEAPEGKLFAGLGVFAAPGHLPLCSLNLIHLRPVENDLTGDEDWELETDIFAVNPRDLDPREMTFQPVGLFAQRDGELLALITDGDGRLYASQHDVLDEYYPDAVRDLEPRIDDHSQPNLFHGLAPPRKGVPLRVLAALQRTDERELLVVARVVEGEPLVLRRFNLNNGALDTSW